ncbi:kinase-like domain-containing protein [Gigaspora rosea]|uniref:Kinase-like domain-containing protein n=1 Tax=Gigaspora rosea TaxID=44941 RepID=A0A397UXM3_9GLOM|nr:kinase-like domain-containing protein [Gigaspora rosea]
MLIAYSIPNSIGNKSSRKNDTDKTHSMLLYTAPEVLHNNLYTSNLKLVAQLEEAFSSQHINYFNYNEFTDFEQIGHRGFSEMYKCKWKDLRITVALKNLSVNNNNFQIVKEFAEDGNLQEYLKINYLNLQLTDKLRIAKEIVLSLNFLHKCNIVHQNLKTYCNIGLEIPAPKNHKLAIFPNIFNHLNLSSGIILSNDLKNAYIADLELSTKFNISSKSNSENEVYLFGMFIWEILIHSKELGRLPSAEKIYKVIKERQNAEKIIPINNY